MSCIWSRDDILNIVTALAVVEAQSADSDEFQRGFAACADAIAVAVSGKPVVAVTNVITPGCWTIWQGRPVNVCQQKGVNN
jgi:hypothetical protein